MVSTILYLIVNRIKSWFPILHSILQRYFFSSSFPPFVPFLHLTKCFFTPVSAAIESFFRHFLCSSRKPSSKNPLAAVHPRHGSDPELSASPAHEKTEREANERVQKKLILPGLEKIRSWHASSSSSLNRLTASQINPCIHS